MPLVVSLALVTAFSGRVVPAGGAISPLHIDVGVIVERHLAIAPLFIADVVKEAGEVWAPYGVSVAEASLGIRSGMTYDAVLSVDLTDRPISTATTLAAWETHLAAIRFTKDGTASTRIDLYYPGALRLAAKLGVGDRLARRIAGRALAHEIGHYLLRSPRHAAEGLMLRIHPAVELASADRSPFALSTGDLNRLRALWSEPHGAGTDLAR